MPKLHFGSRGGVYYKKKGKKVYVKRQNSFGMTKDEYRRKMGYLLDIYKIKLREIMYEESYKIEYLKTLIQKYDEISIFNVMNSILHERDRKENDLNKVIERKEKEFYKEIFGKNKKKSEHDGIKSQVLEDPQLQEQLQEQQYIQEQLQEQLQDPQLQDPQLQDPQLQKQEQYIQEQLQEQEQYIQEQLQEQEPMIEQYIQEQEGYLSDEDKEDIQEIQTEYNILQRIHELDQKIRKQQRQEQKGKSTNSKRRSTTFPDKSWIKGTTTNEELINEMMELFHQMADLHEDDYLNELLKKIETK